MSELNTNKDIIACLLSLVIICAFGSALALNHNYLKLALIVGSIGGVLFIALCVWSIISAKAIK